MGAFHAFYIVQMVPNRAKDHIHMKTWFFCKSSSFVSQGQQNKTEGLSYPANVYSFKVNNRKKH